jgi:hypothetical protein
MTLGLNQLVEYLTWTDSTPQWSTAWLKNYQNELESKLDSVIASSQIMSDSLGLGLQLLNSSAKQQFVTDPFVANALAFSDLSLSARQVELAARLALWLSRSIPPHLRTSLSIQEFGGPEVYVSGILIDFSREYRFPDRGSGAGSLAPIPQELHSLAIERLEAAIGALAEIRTAAFQFVKELTLCLAIRSEGNEQNSFTSGSFAGYAGLSLITNPFAKHVDGLKLADAILHEAIHAAIYMYEVTNEPLLSDKPSGPIRVQSPWTGTFLTCDQYVQACFVWFGLASFWNAALSQGCQPSDRIRALFGRAVKGFDARPVKRFFDTAGQEAVRHGTKMALEIIEGLTISGFSSISIRRAT